MEDKNIAEDMIEHGGIIDNDKTGLCTVRECVKYILLSGDKNGELCYFEDGVRYNIIINVVVNDNKDN